MNEVLLKYDNYHILGMSIEGYLTDMYFGPKILCQKRTVSRSILEPRTRFKARFRLFTLI